MRSRQQNGRQVSRRGPAGSSRRQAGIQSTLAVQCSNPPKQVHAGIQVRNPAAGRQAGAGRQAEAGRFQAETGRHPQAGSERWWRQVAGRHANGDPQAGRTAGGSPCRQAVAAGKRQK